MKKLIKAEQLNQSLIVEEDGVPSYYNGTYITELSLKGDLFDTISNDYDLDERQKASLAEFCSSNVGKDIVIVYKDTYADVNCAAIFRG